MGAPANLDEVSLFLKNMFNDENIITVKNKFLRKIISFLITTTRQKEAKNNYELIGGKSPLLENTEKLITKFQNSNKDKYITYAMRYTPPFSKDIIKKLMQKNVNEVFLIPLYPQYSTTTTKSSIEDFLTMSKKLNFQAKIDYTERFYTNKLYNQAVIEQIKKGLQKKNPSDYDLIFSAHSLPQKIIDKGDTYNEEIIENANIIKSMLKNRNIFFNQIHIAYQSKLGPVKWLKPSLEEKLKSLKNKKVIIYPISFLLDNSETKYELSIEYARLAKKLNFEKYIVCECLNDNEKFIHFLNNLT